MRVFFEYFNIILTGNKDESRNAARQIRKFLYSSSNEDDKYQDIASIIENAPEEYKKISEDWRQENFVIAVSVLYYLHNREEQPDFLFPWLFQLLQHKNGNIRNAAVRMFRNELGPLTVHIRFPNEKFSSFDKFSPKQADFVLYYLFLNLNNLINNLCELKYEKYKYVSSLPNGAYKSVQMVYGTLFEYCGKKYMKHLEDFL